MILFKRNLLCFSIVALWAAGATNADTTPNISPFLPSEATSTFQPGQSDPNSLQLRGIMNLGASPKFCIYDPVKKNSVWLAVNEKGHEYIVTTADLNHGIITLDQQGRKVTLEIENNHVSAAKVNKKNKTSEPLTPEQQLKLKAIADLVRKRQLEREQALSMGYKNILNNPDTDTNLNKEATPGKRVKRNKSKQ